MWSSKGMNTTASDSPQPVTGSQLRRPIAHQQMKPGAAVTAAPGTEPCYRAGQGFFIRPLLKFSVARTGLPFEFGNSVNSR